jgi:anthranilate synthase/aminodeoxychorismate synthase-like glutamine amidotransferase
MLLLDNNDSFTWNLVELIRKTDVDSCNIVTSVGYAGDLVHRYHKMMFSPGPGLPSEHPAMFHLLNDAEKRLEQGGSSPAILGICLGMQAIALHFGGNLYNLPSVVHGQPRELHLVRHDHPLFDGISNMTPVGLYHSWAVDRATLPDCLEILAETGDGTIMALAHKSWPIWGVQFHPESYMTPQGPQMILNWLNG